MRNSNNPYQNLPGYVLRTPILSFDFYKKLTAKESLSSDTLKAAFNDPLVKEACFLASPTLYFELEKWMNGEYDSKKEDKIRFSLLKYLSRMSTRCTPFGLFAGCSLGEFEDYTSITHTSPDLNSRHTRLDMNYLVALSQDLSKKKEIREQLLFYPNTSIYASGHQLRYIEYYYVDSRRHHHIVEVHNSKYLQKILSRATSGAYLSDFTKLLVEDDIAKTDAEHFITELVDSQLLISELEPSVSGPEFLSQIVIVLKKLEGTSEEIEFLEKIQNQLNGIDDLIGNPIEKYLAISEYLKKHSTSFELKYLFQTDMKLQPKKNKLSREVIVALKKGMVLLNKLTPPTSENNLNKFKEAFFERYGEREMPLSKVLDVETGIGYIQDNGSGDVNPLVDDIVLPVQKDPYNKNALHKNDIHRILEQKLIECDRTGAQKINLTDKDFREFPLKWDDLPDTLSTMIKITCEDGIEKIQFSGMGGSSAANLLGRFCHGDATMHRFTQNIVQSEGEMNPDKILAEIVHLPEARVGNILMRPSFRDYEIPYLAKSSLPLDCQIPLGDLFISVRNDTVIIRSKKWDKEIIPRLSNAHNFSVNALPIYQFLCDMQTQNLRSGVYFNFGFSENNRAFLPRVEYDNLILHETKWKVQKKDIEVLQNNIESLNVLQKEVSDWRDRLNIPQYVLLSDGDNELLINFENMTSVQMLLETVKTRTEFLLTEFLFANDGIVKSDNGHYTHQMVVTFFNEKKLESQKKNKHSEGT